MLQQMWRGFSFTSVDNAWSFVPCFTKGVIKQGGNKKIEAFQFPEWTGLLPLAKCVRLSSAQMVSTAHSDRYSLVVFENSDT